MPEINFTLPTPVDEQLLVGAVFAESSTKYYGGENSDEKICISLCVINMAYYARQKKSGGKTCYNSSYGDGTILSAIRKGFVAYGGTMWGKVMSGDRLKSKKDLEKALNADEVEHLRLSVNAVGANSISSAPLNFSGLNNRVPLQFNKAENSPPSSRTEKVGKVGSHTFYGFKAGRECE